MSFPIKGSFIKKKPSPQPTGDDFVKSVNNLNGAVLELNKVKDNVISVVDNKIEEVDTKVKTAIETHNETVINLVEKTSQELENLKNEAIDKVNSLEPQIGVPGKDADEIELEKRITAKIPIPLDTEKLKKEFLAEVKFPKISDITKAVLKALPENKASLKIIQEKIEIDPISVIEKIMALKGKFKLKTANIDGLDQTIKAFQSQLGRGYLHGGGDTVAAGTNISITTNTAGQKVISATPVASGVTSVNNLTGAITLASGTGISLTPVGNIITISATSGGGDVVGPSSATDKAIARFNTTTGKLIQNSSVIIDDSGNLTIPSAATYGFAGTSAGFQFQSGNIRFLASDGGAYFYISPGQVYYNSSNLTFANGGTPEWIFVAPTVSGQLAVTNGNGSAGVGLDISTNGLLKLRNTAFNADANLTVGSFAMTGDFTLTGGGGVTISAGSYYHWNSQTYLTSPADGQMNLNNNAVSAGIGLDFATDSVLKIRTRAQTAFAALSSSSLLINGSSSGVISILPQSAAGTYNFNLPTTAGSAGQVLTSQGGGSTAMTWSNISQISYQVAQTSHGFSVGNIIRSNGTANQYTKSQADSSSDAEVVGYVTVVTDANNFTYITEGIVTTGVPTNTAGTGYFLDPSTAGAVTATGPTTSGQVNKPLLTIIQSATVAYFHNYRGALISAATLTPYSPTVGGTGIANNAANTLTYSGNFGLTLTLSGATSVTLPTAGTLATRAGTETLTNKWVQFRLVSVSAPGATPSTNTDNLDIAEFTGLATAITSMTTNLTGTPINGQMVEFIFLDNGTARAITWGTSFANGGLVNLPTTTVISTVLRVLVQYQTIASLNKWVCIAVA